jgi:hypothetical protein
VRITGFMKALGEDRLACARAWEENELAGKPGAFYSRGKTNTFMHYNTRDPDASWRRFLIAQETADE